MKNISKLLSILLSLVLCAGMVAPALAVSYDIDAGSVYVEKDVDKGVYSYQGKNGEKTYTSEDEEIVITGTSTQNTVVVGQGVTDTTITLKDVNISSTSNAAMSIGANSDVTVELDGENTLAGGKNHAGLELNDKNSSGVTVKDSEGGCVTIQDNGGEKGSLTATGGDYGAGIGSGKGSNAGDITISNTNVTATGGNYGAGIGSGSTGCTGNITIDHADVTATGGNNGAGIGAGNNGEVGDITISNDANVTASGGNSGAGIGSSWGSSKVGDITIEGGSGVTATGGNSGAGIGSGSSSTISNIKIDQADVTAVGGKNGAGIGSGYNGTVKDIYIANSNVTASGGAWAAGIGSYNSGTVGNIDIEGGSIVAKGGDKSIAIGSLKSNAKGTITLKDLDSLITLSSATISDHAIGKNGATVNTNQGILNGVLAAKGETAQATIYIMDGEGNEIVSIDMRQEGSSTPWSSFAAILPEGTYYMYATSDTDPEPWLIPQTDGSYAYVVKKDAMCDAELNGDKQDGLVDVEYAFASSDTDMELPEELLELLGTGGQHVFTKDDLVNGISSDERYEDIEVEGGVWSFDGWMPVSALDKEGKLTSEPVKVVGTWTFTPKTPDPVVPPEQPVTPPTGGDDIPVVEYPDNDVELSESAVPLASGPVTRAEFIDYLWRHEGKPASDGACTFADVPEDHRFILALSWAEQSGIIKAYSEGSSHEGDTFDPDELITVAAVREFLGNYARVFGTNAVAVSDLVGLTGADFEVVLNCDEVLAEFFGEK